MQQMALARLIFDGVMEAFPKLRFGFLEAGAGWLPDFMHSLHEHWEKRIRHFDPSVEPGITEFLVEFAREPNAQGRRAVMTKARGLMRMLFNESVERASAAELEAFRYEHPKLVRDPLEYLENVLPEDIRRALWPHLRAEARAQDKRRTPSELVNALRRTAGTPASD